jgi:hypothetical protein
VNNWKEIILQDKQYTFISAPLENIENNFPTDESNGKKFHELIQIK